MTRDTDKWRVECGHLWSAPNSLYSHNSADGTTVHDTHSCSQHCLALEHGTGRQNNVAKIKIQFRMLPVNDEQFA